MKIRSDADRWHIILPHIVVKGYLPRTPKVEMKCTPQWGVEPDSIDGCDLMIQTGKGVRILDSAPIHFAEEAGGAAR